MIGEKDKNSLALRVFPLRVFSMTTYYQSTSRAIEKAEMPHHNLRQQVAKIVNDKIKRISAKEYVRANGTNKRVKPYSIPAICGELVAMLGELADINTNKDRIEGIAVFATHGEVMERAF